MVEHDLALGDLNTLDLDNILARIELDIVPQAYDRNNRTKLESDLPADHHDTVQKIAALVDIGKRYDTITKLQLDRINRKQGYHIFGPPDFFSLFHLGFFLSRLLFDLCLFDRLSHGIRRHEECDSEADEQHKIERCEHAQNDQNRTDDHQHARNTEQLLNQKP